MYYSTIGILAVLILLIVNRDILFNRTISAVKPAWKMYRRFLFTVLVYYVTDIVWGIFEELKLDRLLFADTTVYFIAMAAGVLYWTMYTVTYLEEKNTFARILMMSSEICLSLQTRISLLSAIPFSSGVKTGSKIYSSIP